MWKEVKSITAKNKLEIYKKLNCRTPQGARFFIVNNWFLHIYHIYTIDFVYVYKFVTNCNKNDLNGYNIVIEDNKVTTNLGGIYDFREKERRD